MEVNACGHPFRGGKARSGIRSHQVASMVILRTVLHLQMLIATAPTEGTSASGGASAVVMTIILTLVIIGAIMLAIAARRTAMGGRDPGTHLRTSIDRTGRAGSRPTDAWSEAGRRMPVPPREEDRT